GRGRGGGWQGGGAARPTRGSEWSLIVSRRSARRHVLIAIGTRPEAIKMAPVIRELQRRHRHFNLTVCATAQHRVLLDQVVNLFGIPIDFDLDLMVADQTLDGLT